MALRGDHEPVKETPDVVPDRLRAQVEFSGDLFRRATLLQKTKYLDLAPRRQLPTRSRRRRPGRVTSGMSMIDNELRESSSAS